MASLTEIEGIGPSLAAACVKNNFRSIAKIAAAKPNELSAVPGISEKGADTIIASAKSLLPKPRIPKTTTKKKQRAVAPVKVEKKTVAAKSTKKSTDKTKGKPDRKSAKKSSVKSSIKEKKMAAVEGKKKIKKLKKKIKKLKAEKKEILAKESKKSKKVKAKPKKAKTKKPGKKK
jgi:hypothetical protein